jgi:hypothetical protein
MKRLGFAQFTFETCLLENANLHVNFLLMSDNIICQQVIVKLPNISLNKNLFNSFRIFTGCLMIR